MYKSGTYAILKKSRYIGGRSQRRDMRIMAFTKDTFIHCVNEINKHNYHYGNDILYRNCNFHHLPAKSSDQIDTKLSSMIWLIGKAYSADPTRSAAKGTFANKGLGSSFDAIAKGICTSGDYDGFYQNLRELRERSYSYQYENDRDILQKTAELVAILNRMITSTMKQTAVDKALEKTDPKNVVSFCSKFLHFMCPHLFFITDSYSFNGGAALFSGKAERKLYIADDDSSENIEIGKDARAYFKAHPSVDPIGADDLEKAKTDPYYLHCLRCYHLACFLHENGKQCEPQMRDDPNSRYMPRLVDSILMRIT